MKTILIAVAAWLLGSGCKITINCAAPPAPVAWWALTNADGSSPLRTEDGAIYWRLPAGSTNSTTDGSQTNAPPAPRGDAKK